MPRRSPPSASPADPEPASVSPCFVAGTVVATPDGDVPIETLREGDRILSYRGEDGAIFVRRVARIVRTTSDHIRVLELDGQRVETTDAHRFWDAERRIWRCAGELGVGAILVERSDTGITRPVMVTASSRVDREAEVFDLAVDGPEHTYFVAGVAARDAHGGSRR